MKKYILLIALIALWPGYVHAQINQDTVNSDVPGGGGGSGGGLTESDINTPAKLNAFVTPDLVDISGSQALTNKTIDCLGNTCKPLRGTDCTTFDAATGGQYCVDTDDLIIYFCSVGEEEVCDAPEDWVAVSSASTLDGLEDVTLTTPGNGDILMYVETEFVNVGMASLADLNTLLGTAIQDTGTLTDGNLCTYDQTGTEIDCATPTSTFQAAGSYAEAIDDLSDVTETDPQNDDVLVYDTGVWVNRTSVPLADSAADADDVTCTGCVSDGELASTFLKSGDEVVQSVFGATGTVTGGTATTPIILDDTSLQIQEGVDTMTITVPTLTEARAVTFPDAAGEVSLLGQTIGDAELESTFLKEADIDTLPELATLSNFTLSGNSTVLANTTGTLTEGRCVEIDADGNLVQAADACGTGGGSGDITTVGSCTTGDCGIEGGNDIFPFIYEGTANTEETTFSVTDPTADRSIVFPDLSGTVALSANKLDFFAATTSAELKGVISDETGSGGALVFATSPTLTTPTLGVASATSINKVTITAPATGSTLTIADGKTATFSNTMSFASAGDSGVLTVPNATATLVGRDTTDTLTNKTISGANNTLSNIDWASLINVPAFRKTLFEIRPQGYYPPTSSFATMNSRNSIPVLRFNGNVCAIWGMQIPNTYGGNGVTVRFEYTSTETTNDTDWDGSWRKLSGVDVDGATFATAVSADNNANNATSGIPTVVEIAFTDGTQMNGCGAEDWCEFRLCRDDTGDTGGADTIDYGMGAIMETP